jgi:hypothetical protein
MICFVIGGTGILAIIALFYLNINSVVADPTTNRLYPRNLHGTKIYLTQEEDSAMGFFEATSFLGILGAAITIYLSQRDRRS